MFSAKRVHVIFKTHLDVGFTDYAHSVVEKYLTDYIPSAIDLAERMQHEYPHEPFSWTIGSWILRAYLDSASPAQVQKAEAAIMAGHLRWLALPFTTHTEIMNVALFQHGLSISQKLDARFGRKTRAAKMTDVPGHTRAMIRLLTEADVRFLHIGANEAASVPDVPPIFVWRDPISSASLICMVQQDYGSTIEIPGTDQAVALVFTGDNLGPPSLESVRNTYQRLRQEFPGAEFVASNLDQVAEVLATVDVRLPIIEGEIGDTWVQGVGSDPTKISQYRELLRLCTMWAADDSLDTEGLAAVYDHLLLIPEHTWGMDLKTHLQDYEHYDTQALVRARTLPHFQKFEASWAEQRGYITQAMTALRQHNPELHEQAQAALEKRHPRIPKTAPYHEVDGTHFETPSWEITLDSDTGALIGLCHKVTGKLLAEADHPLALLQYETFSTEDYDRYWQQYIRNREREELRAWAYPDNAKPGLQVKTHGYWLPQVRQIYQRVQGSVLEILVEATFAEDAHEIGAPKNIYMTYRFRNDGDIELRLCWFDKPACRLPEAFWLTFHPLVEQVERWAINKLGQWISPLEVVSRGGRTLHGFDRGILYQGEDGILQIDSLDATLVAPGKPSLLDFHNEMPDLRGGMHFNLYNNVWGTNFPMWFEEDASFHFQLQWRG